MFAARQQPHCHRLSSTVHVHLAALFAVTGLVGVSLADTRAWILGEGPSSCAAACSWRGAGCSAESLSAQNDINMSALTTLLEDIGAAFPGEASENDVSDAFAPLYMIRRDTAEHGVVANSASTSNCESVAYPCPQHYECQRFCLCTYTTTTTTTTATIAAELKSVVGAGTFFSLRVDGSVLASGSNAYGQLGDGTIIHREQPVVVLTGVKDVAAGSHHTLFLMDDSRVYAAGRNQFGQLGDECFCTPGMPECRTCQDGRPPQPWPILVQHGVRAIDAGDSHSVFLREDGDVYTVGWNTRGQIGDGTVTSRRIPVLVDTGVSSIAAGAAHTLLLKPDGTVYAFGANSFGQLGDGSTVDKSSITHVHSDVERIWAGITHSMFYRRDGTVHVTGVREPFVGPS